MLKNNKEKEVTLRGYLAAREWDHNDNVVSIDLLTDDEDYEIELNKVGVDLFDFLDEDVEVTGVLRKGRNGTALIRVTSYEPLGNKAPDNDDWRYESDREDNLDS